MFFEIVSELQSPKPSSNSKIQSEKPRSSSEKCPAGFPGGKSFFIWRGPTSTRYTFKHFAVVIGTMERKENDHPLDSKKPVRPNQQGNKNLCASRFTQQN